jgi:hypothetical protein
MDNNAGVSRPGYYLPAGTPATDAIAFANATRAVILPLTNAALQDATLTYDLEISPSGPADPQSNTDENLILFYSTGQNIGSVSIPSPRLLAFDLGGPWRAFRLTRSSLSVGLLADIETLVTGTVFYNNSPFPNTFSVGALDQIVM